VEEEAAGVVEAGRNTISAEQPNYREPTR